MIKVGRWANEHKRAAAVILDRQTYYRDVEDTYQGIKHVDIVPTLSPKNLAQIEIGRDFMFETRLYQARLRCAEVGGTGVPRAGGQGIDRGEVEEDHGRKTS